MRRRSPTTWFELRDHWHYPARSDLGWKLLPGWRRGHHYTDGLRSDRAVSVLPLEEVAIDDR